VAWQGEAQGRHLLALEWLDLTAPGPGYGHRLGRALGHLHRAACLLQPARYGWTRDNFIGRTPQTNTPSAGDATSDWLQFYASQRLAPMRNRLAVKGARPELLDAVEDVIACLPRFFADGHEPRPSLIHGDLWQGNWGMLADGTPVIYDPAVSCSDAEAELAMMELFGTPPTGFWPAYRETGGLAHGYAQRRPLYQLYHLLNHAVLFGGSYAEQALRCAQGLLARARGAPSAP
jgi:protein-ribulosamine 3-kinase